jgi:hypothetical protein
MSTPNVICLRKAHSSLKSINTATDPDNFAWYNKHSSQRT